MIDTESFKMWIDKYLGTTYMFTPNPSTPPELKIDFNTFGILIAIVILIVGWIMLLSIIRKMDTLIQIGNRCQEECGQTYMEAETARSKLYNQYTGNLTKSLNTINALFLTVMGITYASVVGTLIVVGVRARKIKNSSSDDGIKKQMKWFIVLAIVIGLLLLGSYAAFIQQNTQLNFQNKYTDLKKKIKYAGSVSTISILRVIFIIALVFIIYANTQYNNNGYLLKESTSVWLWIGIITVSFVFMFMINTNKITINNQYVIPYGTSINELNNLLNQLRTTNCEGCIISSGVNEGKTINEWMNTMLSRNIKRVHPDEDVGDPFEVLSSNSTEYNNQLYNYIEHGLGKELQDIADVADTNIITLKTDIRKKYRFIRQNNDKMLTPVKSFVKQISYTTAVFIAIIAFIFYHKAYVNYPAATTITSTIISVVLISIAVGIYYWNMGKSVYV